MSEYTHSRRISNGHAAQYGTTATQPLSCNVTTLSRLYFANSIVQQQMRPGTTRGIVNKVLDFGGGFVGNTEGENLRKRPRPPGYLTYNEVVHT